MKPKINFKDFKGNPRNVMFALAFFVIAVVVLAKMLDYTRSIEYLIHSQFVDQVKHDNVKSVHIIGQSAYGILKDGRAFEATVADTNKIWDLLEEHHVDVATSSPSHQFNFWYLLFILLMIGIPFVIWYMLKQARGSNGGAGAIFSMGKSKARLFMPSQIKVNFNSVAGADQAKEELQDLVDFLKNPERYMRLGAKLTRGVLLIGEPGNGKTLLAKAVAGEANCPFFSISGSDFIEVFVGVGASRIRDLFERARRHSPCIIFIDEIDAIGRQRGSGLGGGHDEREQTLNQLLIEMDGFESSNIPVIVIAATNIPDVLDKALLRPGRFDRRIEIPYPDQEGREKILLIHTRTVKLGADVDLKKIAFDTAGLSGADLENLVNQAAIGATKKNHEQVMMQDFEDAYQKLLSQQAANTSSQSAMMCRTTSKPRVFMPSQIKVKFKDVAGNKEAKEELVDVIDFLRNPKKYTRLGARLTRGVLLVGDPGNGKTLLARAVAGEANCPFFSVSGSDFVEMYVGLGASRVRDLFTQARKHSPCIIFIDELDAVGGKRTASAYRNDERDQTLNQLLVEMDGFESAQTPIIVIAATNRKDILDNALLRPGRFDRQVEVPYPMLEGRQEILELHARKVKMNPQVDLHTVARATPGFSGASLAHLINEAAILAAKDGCEEVTDRQIQEARDKIIMGKTMPTKIMSSEELRLTAFHEAGHTLVAALQEPDHIPLYKVTIIPRGFSLGATHYLPEKDTVSRNREEILASITSSLGGRVAEELVFQKISTGASNDFEQATEEARRMVCYYGMSDKLGPVIYKRNEYHQQYSERTAYEIDEEVRSIVKTCYQKAVDLLRNNQDKLTLLAEELLKKETLESQEVYELLNLSPTIRPSGSKE
ncbi:MAG: ATP-dependent zinc metalloprotease FtsH [Candidatus Babeliaceae bacterium]